MSDSSVLEPVRKMESSILTNSNCRFLGQSNLSQRFPNRNIAIIELRLTCENPLVIGGVSTSEMESQIRYNAALDGFRGTQPERRNHIVAGGERPSVTMSHS
jgi:hypothetical protein